MAQTATQLNAQIALVDAQIEQANATLAVQTSQNALTLANLNTQKANYQTQLDALSPA